MLFIFWNALITIIFSVKKVSFDVFVCLFYENNFVSNHLFKNREFNMSRNLFFSFFIMNTEYFTVIHISEIIKRYFISIFGKTHFWKAGRKIVFLEILLNFHIPNRKVFFCEFVGTEQRNQNEIFKKISQMSCFINPQFLYCYWNKAIKCRSQQIHPE